MDIGVKIRKKKLEMLTEKSDVIKHIYYESIQNDYRLKYIEEVREYGKKNSDDLYVITEKVDGSNIQIYNDGTVTKIGSRNNMIDSKLKTFGKEILHIYLYTRELSKEIFDICKNEIDKSIKVVIIFSELYGPKIQKNVYYGDNPWYYPFDIAIQNNERTYFLTYDVFEEIMEKTEHKIYAKQLHIGTLEECLKYKTKFDTTLCNKKDNVCEGIVIKPYNKIVYIEKNNSRLIIKKKNEEFEEIQPVKHKMKIPFRTKRHIKKLWEKLEPYITPQRLGNVLSKMGRNQSLHKIAVNLQDDSICEFEKDFENWMAGLKNWEIKKIKRFTNMKSREIIRNYYSKK